MREAELEAAQKFARQDRDRANSSGLTKLTLDSTWWGNKAFGEWCDTWWVMVDGETDDALHVSEGIPAQDARGTDPYTRQMDEWVPKSVSEKVVEPEWEEIPADGDAKGTLEVGPAHPGKYGRKRDVSGDTYTAFKEDDLKSALSCDNVHAAWSGNVWQIDAGKSSVEEFVQEATDMGYSVKLLP